MKGSQKHTSQRGETSRLHAVILPRCCCKAVATEGSTQLFGRSHEAPHVFQEADHNSQGSWCGLVRLTWCASWTIS